MPHNELSPPPPLPSDGLRVVALGGIGEVGRNMTVFEFGGRLLAVDCGMLLGKSTEPGVDLVLPDFSWIRPRLEAIEAVVLTHGHEDHIGALPYLLRERPDIPLVGSRFTLALIAAKLAEHRITPEMREVKAGDRCRLGDFGCEFLAVNHSIPDALAVAIRTPAGMVLHTGDFKMDQTPLDGRLTDLPGFARLGDEGVTLLLSDSTNAEVPGFVPSERAVGRVLMDVIRRAPQRVIVACFSSHVHRVQQVLDAAAANGRHVAFVGRSMIRNMKIASDLGLLKIPPGLVVERSDIDKMPEDRVLLVCTGSQGEPLSALSRMANRDHAIHVTPGDVVVLASSLIPGNESAVFRVINGLSRLGATVVHKALSMVHVSGHAPAGELQYVLNVVRPANLMPVHGEWRHLRAHAQLGRQAGIPEDRIVLAENGVVVDVIAGQASIVGTVPCGYVYVDGLAVGDVGPASLKDRRILGEEGVITITVVIDSVTGRVVGGPEITAKGFADDPSSLDPVVKDMVSLLEQALSDGTTDVDRLAHLIRHRVGRWVSSTYQRRPLIIPVVVEV
ncbi:MAG: ribonuclease J [Actinomycetota bacterium]|nr:ribonuclease J [Actinomycetota bacterium]